MKSHIYKTFFTLILSISCLLFANTLNTFSLLAHEEEINMTNQNYASNSYKVTINSSNEELIDSILNDDENE